MDNIKVNVQKADRERQEQRAKMNSNAGMNCNMNNMNGQQNMNRQQSTNGQEQSYLRQILVGTRDNIKVITSETYEEFGVQVEIIEYQKLLGSTNVYGASSLWFMNEQNIKCRQIGMYINNSGVKIENGAMSYFQGPLNCTTGIINVQKALGQFLTGALTNEKMIMPEYTGSGVLVLEPSFKHFITLKLNPNEQIVCDKGMFFAASQSVRIEPCFAGSPSGTLLGREGIFQQLITGPGMVILESPVPMCEINRIKLNNDILRVDGNFALLRTGNIQMSVEPVSRSLVGSAMSGEGLVNVFRGTGEVWIAPTIKVYDALNIARSRGGDIGSVDFNTSTGRAK